MPIPQKFFPTPERFMTKYLRYPSASVYVRRAFAVTVLLFTQVDSIAGIGDDFEELEGKTIVYAGAIEQLECPPTGKYDCLKWPMDLFKTVRGRREICFVPNGYARCRYKCNGLIAIDDAKKPYVFFQDGLGGDLKKHSFEAYKCPSLY
ncbi:MAG: hypothetical protein IPO00_01525 [Betaproteobacteria bacterium]|nr:hypothetical protein [Betaproteobacteria bacterium]